MRDEEKSTIHAERGFAYLKDRLLDNAIEELKLSLSYAPDNMNALINLGTALQQKGLIDEAIKLLESVLKQGWVISSEVLGTIYYNLGNTYRDKKDEEKAIEQYKKAIENRPNHASTWFNLGQSLFTLGKLDDAAKAYKRALEYNPEHSEAKIRLELFNELKDSGDYNQVKNMITRPEDEYEHLLIEGEKYSLTEKFSSAIEQFKEALRLYPEEGEIYIRLARTNLELMYSRDITDSEELQENLRLLEKAEHLIASGKSKRSMDMFNGLSELHDTKARCFISLEQYEQAVEELEKALKIDPSKKDSISLLEKTNALIQVKKGKSKGCFIATAVYNSQFVPEVQILCQFRDNHLSKFPVVGIWLIRTYYKFSPSIADIMKQSFFLKQFFKIVILIPVVRLIILFSNRGIK